MDKSRSVGIDSFRLLAAACVMTLHVGDYPGFTPGVAGAITLSGRWAVPFFFMVTGLFLGAKDTADRTLKPITRFLLIFPAASLALLPLCLWERGLRGTYAQCVSQSVFLWGTYHHLWFLGSMLTALLFVFLSDQLRLKKFLPACAVLFLVLFFLLDSYNPFSTVGVSFVRQMSGVPFLYLGMLIGRHRLEIPRPWLWIVAGFSLQVAEAVLLHAWLGKKMTSHQMLLGTLPFALGMLGLARTVDSPRLRGVAAWGRDYSLLLYIIHPCFIVLSAAGLAAVHAGQAWSDGLIVPLTFALSLAAAIGIKRLLPFLYSLLMGESQTLVAIDALLRRQDRARGEAGPGLPGRMGDRPSPPAG